MAAIIRIRFEKSALNFFDKPRQRGKAIILIKTCHFQWRVLTGFIIYNKFIRGKIAGSASDNGCRHEAESFEETTVGMHKSRDPMHPADFVLHSAAVAYIECCYLPPGHLFADRDIIQRYDMIA